MSMIGSDKNCEDAPNEQSVLEEQDSINNVSNVSEFEFVATEEELKGKIVDLEHDNKELRAELVTMKQDLRNSEALKKACEDSLTRMRLNTNASLKLSDERIESLEADLDAAEEEETEIFKKHGEEVQQMKNQLKKAKAEIVQLIEMTNKTRNDGRQMIEESNERHAQEIQQLHEQEKQLETEIETLEEELRAANKKLVDVVDQKKLVKKLKLEIKEIGNLNNNLRDENDLLEDNLKNSKEQEEKLKSRVETLEGELGASTEEVGAQQEHIRKLEQEIMETNNLKCTLSKQIYELDEKCIDAEKTEDMLKHCVASLKKELGAALKKLVEADVHKEQIRKLSQENDELEKKLSNSEKMRHNLEVYNAELFEKLTLREKDLERSKEQEENLKSRIEALDAEVLATVEQLDEADAQKEKLERKIEASKMNYDILRCAVSKENDSVMELEAKWKRRADTLERALEAEKKKEQEKVRLLDEEVQKRVKEISRLKFDLKLNTGYKSNDYSTLEEREAEAFEKRREALEKKLIMEQQEREQMVQPEMPKISYHHEVFDEVTNGKEKPNTSESQPQ